MEGYSEIFELEDAGKPYNIRHRCFHFAREVIEFVKKHAALNQSYSSLFDQLIRSAASIGANIVEGSAGSSRKDWKKFLIIALKSANETKYWLCLIRDTQKSDKEKLNELMREADEISKILASIILKG